MSVVVSLYDTMSRSVVELSPAEGKTLRVYSCGPTVYRYMHVGNLRTFLMADLIRRAFEYQRYEVRQIQNITDVGHMTDDETDRGEDKMLVAAGLEDKSPAEIADHYTKAFLEDVQAFNIRPAAAYPRATDYIAQMIEIIRKLIERGHAYERGGGVYYDVESFPEYGKLSGNTVDKLVAGHRKEIDDPNKKHHADFLLWRPAGPRRLMRWPSPWGEGFPGWHIECSAMSLDLLGETFDLHTGGEDNVFPHHEDEIAQSEGTVGHRVVRHWAHGAHLLAEGRKMAKSTENFYTLRDLEERDHREPLAARLLFLQSRYRAQMNFTLEALGGAERTLERWRRLLSDWSGDRTPESSDARSFEKRFVEAMNDDLDTPTIIALVAELMSSKELAPGEKFKVLDRWDRFLGLDLATRAPRKDEIPPQVSELIDKREVARRRQDWGTADRIRHQLLSIGIEIDDTPEGPKPRPRGR